MYMIQDVPIAVAAMPYIHPPGFVIPGPPGHVVPGPPAHFDPSPATRYVPATPAAGVVMATPTTRTTWDQATGLIAQFRV